MDRRTFVETLGGIGMVTAANAAPAAEKPKRVFLLEQFFLKNGTQRARIDDYLSQGSIPALSRLQSGPVIVLEALVAAHMPQVAVILGFDSAAQCFGLRPKLKADKTLSGLFEAWERGDEPPYEHCSVSLLEAADYCPEIKADPARKAPRIFELRTYHSPTWRQLAALHERFAGPEIRIFHRSGVRPILYTSTLAGQMMPNLTYLIPFDNLAEREKAWAAFGADPEWVKVRKESIDKHGQISSVMQMSLWRATPYSPIK
ncbi:MAG: NIPSNAP family protein [Acidobacteria bacterium]|nr:NIPSNAP family protein [Acidobacteriota bacterium]